MGLEETVDGMLSKDHIKRFKAEYNQLTIRLDKLNKIIDKAKTNKLEFTLSNSLSLLELQASYMEAYAGVLRDRAANEGISLD